MNFHCMGHSGRTFPECSNLPHSLPNEAKKHNTCVTLEFL